MLFPILVDTEALESEISPGAIVRLHGAGEEDGGFGAEVGHAVFHHGEFERDDAGHFDGAAEGDFAVTL